MNTLADTFVLATFSSASSEILIKSTITIGLAAVACELLHRHSAALRHRIWVFALTATLVVPVTSLLFPQVAFHVLPRALDVTYDAASPSTANSSKPFLISSADPTMSSDGLSQPILDAQSTTTSAADDLNIQQRSAAVLPTITVQRRTEQWLVTCWLIGTVTGSTFFLVVFAMQSFRLRRLRPIDDKDWAESVTAAAKSLGLQRLIVALESNEACVPAVVGVLVPRLLVPCDWRTWSVRQRQCILLHELAHIKRRDILAQLIGRLAMLVYWFNPLVWYAVRQLRAERELASDDCVLQAGQTASDYAEQLLRTLESHRATAMFVGVAMAHSARLDQRVLAILDPKRRRGPVGSRMGIVLGCAVGILCVALGGATLVPQEAIAQPTDPKSSVATDVGVWQEKYTIEYPGSLPVSVEFSDDGKMLLTGDTSGELMALIFGRDQAMWRWKAKVDGSHAAAAFSADQKEIYATTKHGVCILDVDQGKEVARIEEQDSNPTLVRVFPDKTIAEQYTRQQIVFGTPRGYFVKSWVKGKLPDTVGTIQTSTVAEGAEPADAAALPLAVDPKGRSAIMTGPIDATGKVSGVKGKNVLWAYVCGDYDEGSPGNRVMVGHTATVVSAAWSKVGGAAVTGDVDGRVIVWDAKTMKESSRLEFGGRIAALAVSDDGQRTAAYVLGKQGEVFVWETNQPTDPMKPIHTDLSDFGGPTAYASLDFAPDGKRLAGCAIDKKWLTRLGELVGKVHAWELAGAPHAQLPPKHAYSEALPEGSSSSFVILHDYSILTPAGTEGAIDYRSVADGGIQVRTVLGKFHIGSLKLSTDRRWLAMEQHTLPPPPNVLVPPSREFDVGVLDMKTMRKQVATIPSCTLMLDVASGGKAVAVVRGEKIELWDIATSKLLKEAPFKYARIDAASFSPDGKLLAISDRNELVLWQWEKNTHERIDLGRRVGSLTFSPDGKFLAEGPSPRENIQIRDINTRKIVQALANEADRSMNVPGMAYSQGGRVLIGCDDITLNKDIPVPHRIHLWDTVGGSLVHQLKTSGMPKNLSVSPNGRYLIAMIEDDEGMKLTSWRLDGQQQAQSSEPKPPAAVSPR